MNAKNLPKKVKRAIDKSVLIATALLVWSFLPTVSQALLNKGEPAPSFKVKSGDDKEVTLDTIKGKTIVLFYETRDAIHNNKDLKKYLEMLYNTQPKNTQKEIFRLVVINCMEATSLTTWKEKLVENSMKQGITIYGDWTGDMFAAYRMKDNDTNFMIIDKRGIVRFAESGRIENGRFEEIRTLLLELTYGR
jgi:alkyl hydroperoxide reductase subunit AhpC